MANIRKGKKSDLPFILELIKELAEYEHALDKVSITLEDLENDGFGNSSLYWFLVAEIDSKIVGMAFYYIRYSTWEGKYLFLEDFVVTETYRNKGIGTKLFGSIIKIAKQMNMNKVMWEVLSWNTSAIQFYKKYNAQLDDEWISGKLSKEQLDKL